MSLAESIFLDRVPFTLSYDYIIYTDGTNYFAFNTKTKQIDFVNTDASTVIQSAINALTNGGSIFIRKNRYTITKIVGVSESIFIESDGAELINGATPPYTSGVNDAILSVGGTNTSLRISGLRFSDPLVRTQKGIVTTGSYRQIIIENCYFNQLFWGIWANDGMGTLIKGCTFYNNQDGVVNDTSVKHTIIDDCWFYGNTEYAISNVSGEPITIRNSVFRSDDELTGTSLGLNPVKLGSFGDTVTGCAFLRDSFVYAFSGSSIIGNFFQLSGISALGSLSNVLISGNHFYNTRGITLQASGATFNNISILNNHFNFNGGQGMFINGGGGSSGILIAGNKFYNVARGQAGNTAYSAVALFNTINNVAIISNHFDTGTYGISLSNVSDALIGGNKFINLDQVLNLSSVAGLKIKLNKGYDTETFNTTGLSVPIGVSGAYGSPVSIISLSGVITFPRVKIIWGGTFGTGETVTVNITAVYSDGSTASITKSATTTGSLWLTDDDILALITQGKDITQLQVSASSNLASTSVTVTVDAYGTA